MNKTSTNPIFNISEAMDDIEQAYASKDNLRRITARIDVKIMFDNLMDENQKLTRSRDYSRQVCEELARNEKQLKEEIENLRLDKADLEGSRKAHMNTNQELQTELYETKKELARERRIVNMTTKTNMAVNSELLYEMIELAKADRKVKI